MRRRAAVGVRRRAAEPVIDTCRSLAGEARPHPAAGTRQARGPGRLDPRRTRSARLDASDPRLCGGEARRARARSDLPGRVRRAWAHVRHRLSSRSVSVCLFFDPILMMTLLLCELRPVKKIPELLESIPSRKLELRKARVNQVSSHLDSHEQYL